MLETSLATKSYVVETEQAAQGYTFKQLVHVDTGRSVAHSLLNITQQGNHVKTEALGTPTTDYSRFLSIAPTTQSMQTAKVLNVWSSNELTPQTDTAPSGQQLYVQSTLGIGLPIGSVPVPIVDFNERDRRELLRRITNERIFIPNVAGVRKERKNGRQVYTYDVQVQAIPYIRLMQVVAKQLGVSSLDSVDPNTYGNSQNVRVKMSIDVLSRRLVSVDSGQGFSQRYTAYDVPVKTEIPRNAIPATEFQRRLQEVED